MAHMRPLPSEPEFRQRNLIDDLDALIRKYRLRNHPEWAMTAEQRRQWAADISDIAFKLAREIEFMLGRGDRYVTKLRLQARAQLAEMSRTAPSRPEQGPV